MKTFLIELDNISPEVFKELMGFILTVGLNFRKIDKMESSGTGKTLFVELATKSEEKALNEFLDKQGIPKPIVIGNANKAILDGKKIGTFSAVNDVSAEYLDKSTGRKFSIVRN